MPYGLIIGIHPGGRKRKALPLRAVEKLKSFDIKAFGEKTTKFA